MAAPVLVKLTLLDSRKGAGWFGVGRNPTARDLNLLGYRKINFPRNRARDDSSG